VAPIREEYATAALSSCYRAACAELTATVTATAAVNRYQQRPPTAHNTHTIRANWGYVRPEKRKVGSSILPLTTSSTQCRSNPDQGKRKSLILAAVHLK
jgi:hypothetical protein